MLVTGAGGTIGREVCRLLASHGARLAITDVAAEPLGSIMSELQGGGSPAWGRAADAADLDDFSALVAELNEAAGRVEVLINVAGTFKVTDFAGSEPSDWSDMISANLLTALVACRSVLPGMLEARSGAIVNFASTAGEYGSIRPAAVYAAAKAGVIGFTKSLAREVSPMGVRVNAISPGPVDTPALKAVTVTSVTTPQNTITPPTPSSVLSASPSTNAPAQASFFEQKASSTPPRTSTN